MPQVVTDVLEGQPLAESPRRAGMAERVRTVVPKPESAGMELLQYLAGFIDFYQAEQSA